VKSETGAVTGVVGTDANTIDSEKLVKWYPARLYAFILNLIVFPTELAGKSVTVKVFKEGLLFT